MQVVPSTSSKYPSEQLQVYDASRLTQETAHAGKWTAQAQACFPVAHSSSSKSRKIKEFEIQN